MSTAALSAAACLFARRYAAVVALPYFALRAPGATPKTPISSLLNGCVWASYALGMLLAPLCARSARRLGARTVSCIGLVVTALQCAAFALTPLVASPLRPWIWVVANLASGCVGGLAETAVIAKASASFQDAALGTTMALITASCTLGAVLGPIVGGALSDALAAQSGDLAFAAPLASAAAVCAAASVAVLLCTPREPTALPLAHLLAGAELTERAQQELDALDAFFAGDSSSGDPRCLPSARVGLSRLSLVSASSSIGTERPGAPGLGGGAARHSYGSSRSGGGGIASPGMERTPAKGRAWAAPPAAATAATAASSAAERTRDGEAAAAAAAASAGAAPRDWRARWQRWRALASPSLCVALLSTAANVCVASSLAPFLACVRASLAPSRARARSPSLAAAARSTRASMY